MPVLSPHRSTSSSGLSGSYRSTFSSSLDRPYSNYGVGSSYVSPRISTYSERYSTRSYSDTNGRTFYSRAGSISEDGYTSRFREESREGSSRRESSARAGGSAIDTLLESPVRRTAATTDLTTSSSSSSASSAGGRIGSTLNVVESIADLRNKYSASNYVPAVIRNRDVTRSRTAGDIGLPPTTSSTSTNNTIINSSTTSNGYGDGIHKLKKVTETNNLNSTATNNTNNIVVVVAEADVDNMRQQDDTNGNNTSCTITTQTVAATSSSSPVSVLEMTKKFEKRVTTNANNGKHHHGASQTHSTMMTTTTTSTRRGAGATAGAGGRSHANVKGDGRDNNVAAALTVVGLSATGATGAKSHAIVDAGRTTGKTHKVAHAGAGTTTSITTTTAVTTITTTTTTATASARHNHTNDFASYIPIEAVGNDVKQSPPPPPPAENGDMDRLTNGTQKGKKSNKDVNATSPARASVNRSPITHNASSASGGGALGGASSNRNSLERDGSHPRSGGGGGGIGGGYDASSMATPIAFDRSSPTKQMGLNGLKNIGNTCFMNSVIQCLSNTKPLLEYVKKDGYASEINSSLSSMKGALIKAFALVIKELWSEDCSDRVVNTVSLKSQIQRFAPRFMGYSQQDAQEFLRYLLEGLHEDVNRVTNKPTPIHTEIDEKLSDHEKASESWQRYLRRDNSKVVDLFVGQFKSTLKCTQCGHCSVTFDPFWDLSLPIPQKTGAIRLSQCLDSFTREETLDGDEKPTCSKCKERRKCTKSFTIHKFPKILVIHLKRFSPTERFRGKLSVTVDFPLEGLDMNAYASESNTQCRYNLYAVSNHSGTTYSGHYTAYCRHPYSMSWHEYNDSRVSSISSKSIVSGEAYVLFYELDGKISAHL